MTMNKNGVVYIVFLTTILAAPLTFFAETDSGTILSEERQEEEKRALQDAELTPPDAEIEKRSELNKNSEAKIAKPKSKKETQNVSCNESQEDD